MVVDGDDGPQEEDQKKNDTSDIWYYPLGAYSESKYKFAQLARTEVSIELGPSSAESSPTHYPALSAASRHDGAWSKSGMPMKPAEPPVVTVQNVK